LVLIFGYLLLVLIPVAAIWYIVWDHKRKTAERDAVSADRLRELMGAAALRQRAEDAASSAAATPAAPRVEPAAPAATRAEPVAPVAQRPEPAEAVPLYAPRDRVLTAPQTLLYYLLRTGLPDHIIFARVTLASVLEAGPGLAGFAREEQIRRLAALTVDFVVSDKNMKPVAVIEIATRDATSAMQADRASARTRVTAAGVRYLELDATQLPRKDAVRAIVLGDTDAAESARATAAGAAR
jgi:hypothetical protein